MIEQKKKESSSSDQEFSQNSIVIPSIILGGVNAYRLWLEHWEHQSHMPPKSEQPEYSFQNIRTKNYFWGDGDKVS
jgi:cytochrome c oxidase subunit 6a